MSDELAEILKSEPEYRRQQIYLAWFDLKINGYDQITTLSKTLRQKLSSFPWLTVEPAVIKESKKDKTQKALLELSDGEAVETVLMPRPSKKQNSPEASRWTVCLSSQVGCPIGCSFCATGAAGFRRNLSAQEIVDQARFWQRRLKVSEEAIGNVVLMGQGEPLLNYDAVKEALWILINGAKVGPSNIVLSTCGPRLGLEKIITDKDFPPVRFALSLHSAIEATRKKLVPAHWPGFFEFFISWAKKYHAKFPSRSHFIGLEYIMLAGVNDDKKHLDALARFAEGVKRTRINLILYNQTVGPKGTSLGNGSPDETARRWQKELMRRGFVATLRLSQGTDIGAACGQLKSEREKL